MTHAVPSALRALLVGSVDYAGLFPPAGLALESALANQAGYVLGSDAWMLGSFVLPTAKMRDAGPLLAGRFGPMHPLRVSVLGPKADPADGFLKNLQASLEAIAIFRQEHGETAVVDQFESALSGALLREAAKLIETLSSTPLRTFWEVPFSESLPAALHDIAERNAQVFAAARCRPFGVKLRTGGTDAAAFPSPAQLAAALVAARDAGVALKFTAGLHHPVRHFDDGVGTHMHGFLNVFAAAVLAHEHRLDAAETRAILEDENPASFRFDADGFAWRDCRVSTEALPAHRQFVTSFGSCSFDEPRDDLHRLGLLA